jgi:hypothetical protein
MIALEQLFSVEDTRKGLRFGALDASDFGAWDNFWFCGRRCSIRANGDGVALEIPGILSFSSNRPLVVRQFDPDTGCFAYRADEDVDVTIVRAGAARRIRLAAAPHGTIQGDD